MTDLSAILTQMILAAQKAGDFIRTEKENFDYGKVEIKGLNDLVSYVDRGSEEILVKELKTIVPEAGFLVEENTLSSRKALNWIVDPLDGTTNFIHGIPCYAVSIALEKDQEIIAGVVLEVSRNECFSAAKGQGAYLNARKIKVSERQNLSESLIATGFPIYNFTRLNNYLAALQFFMQHTHGLRRMGAAAADLCYLACGRVDAFYEYNLQAWDVAAGALIAREAGAVVSDFSGGNNWLYGKEICASNKLLSKEFGEAIGKFFNA